MSGQTASGVPLRIKGLLAFAAVAICAIFLTTFVFHKKTERAGEFERPENLHETEGQLMQMEAATFSALLNSVTGSQSARVRRLRANSGILKKENAEPATQTPSHDVNPSGVERPLAQAAAGRDNSKPVEQKPRGGTTVDSEGKRLLPFQLAPIRYRVEGNIGYSMQRQTIGASKYTTQSLSTTVNTSANSFIWQPWFAQVNGNLGLGFNTTKSTGSKSDSTSISGNGVLSLLPSSRFPFEAHLGRSDSRQSSGLGAASTSYQMTNFGLSQRYRTMSGDSHYMAGYDRNLWQGSDSESDKQDQFRIETSHQLAQGQTLGISGDSMRNVRQSSNQSTLVNILTAHHHYRPAPAFSVESLANLNNTNYHLTQTNSSTSYMQLSSSAFWRSADKPLIMNGGVRLFGFNSTSTTSTTSTAFRAQSANANVGANYDLSRHAKLNGSGNVNVTDSNGSQSVTTNQSVGASYLWDPLKFGAYSYTRSASGNFSNSTSPSGGAQSISLGPGHGLGRNMGLGGGMLAINMGQSSSLGMNSSGPSTLNLTHNGSLAWSLSKDQKTTQLHLSASDSRTLSGMQGFFQLLNMQATLNENLSRNASWNGNLTMQVTRQKTASTPILTTATSSADLSYRHQRAFNVPRLRFTSELRIYSDALLPVLATPDQQETRSWENRLDYSIGRLQLRSSVRLAEVNKVGQSLIWFSMNRSF